jgi:hypothetical protein
MQNFLKSISTEYRQKLKEKLLTNMGSYSGAADSTAG